MKTLYDAAAPLAVGAAPFWVAFEDVPVLNRFADWIASMSDGMARNPIMETPTMRKSRSPAPTAIIVLILFVAMIGLSVWYLSRREPLVIQGEVQSRTFDMAARVDGRIGEIVVSRSQD